MFNKVKQFCKDHQKEIVVGAASAVASATASCIILGIQSRKYKVIGADIWPVDGYEGDMREKDLMLSMQMMNKKWTEPWVMKYQCPTPPPELTTVTA